MAQGKEGVIHRYDTAATVSNDVRDFLEAAGLAAFLHSFVAHGYDEMRIIRLMGNAEMDEVGLKGGHKLKLKEALKNDMETTGPLAAPAELQQQTGAASALPWPEARHGQQLTSSSDRGYGAQNAPAKVTADVTSALSSHSGHTAGTSHVAASAKEAVTHDLSSAAAFADAEMEITPHEPERGDDRARKAENLLARARGGGKPQQRRYIKDGGC